MLNKQGLGGLVSQNINKIITVLFLIAIAFLFISGNEPIIPILENTLLAPILYSLSWPNSIVFNLSIGYISSVIFWILVVYLPDKHRRKLLRENLAIRCRDFRYEIVQVLIWAAGGSETTKLIDELASNHIKFNEYFSANNRERWYAALNGIQGSEMRMHELLLAMRIFSDEVAYVINNVAIDDPTAHRMFRGLSESIYRLQESEADLYDRVKSFGGSLWGILARWNFIDGQLEEDVIEKMINRI
ncbi:MAG: hypothetical protein QM709_02820 [Spongiibacteraceae bacterium]